MYLFHMTLHMEQINFRCYAVIIDNNHLHWRIIPMSADQRIILANVPRLLRDMLNRILLKTEHLKVVQEITEYDNLPTTLEQNEAEWVIMSLPADKQIPEWADSFMKRNPLIKIMALSSDGSWIKMKWLESREQDLTDLSLKELIHILEGNTTSI
jgi:hypothetical protein